MLKIKNFIKINNSSFANSRNGQDRETLNSVVENLLELIESKGEDEKYLWNTAGKILQR
jgi:hypothetical protein